MSREYDVRYKERKKTKKPETSILDVSRMATERGISYGKMSLILKKEKEAL